MENTEQKSDLFMGVDKGSELGDATAYAAATMGHNLPPAERELEAAKDFEAWCKALVVEDAHAAERAAELIKASIAKSKAADSQRATEKQPHLDAGRAVDTAWNPVIAIYKAAGDIARKRLKDFDDAERRRKAAELEAKRKEQEEIERKAAEKIKQGGFAAQVALEEAREGQREVNQVQKELTQKSNYGAAGGRAVGKRKVWRAEITNQDLALAAVRNDPEVIQFMLDHIQKLAIKQKENFYIPGAKAAYDEVY